MVLLGCREGVEDLNRTIKIYVGNGGMTLEADTKHFEEALESMKLVGAKGAESATCQKEMRNTQHE